MLHFISSRRAQVCALVAVAALFASALTGCVNPGTTIQKETEYVYVLPVDSSSDLAGKWISSYSENFAISSTAFTADGYACDNVCTLKETETSGYIYGKYTKVYDYNNAVYTEPEDASNYYHYSYTYDGVEYEMWYPLNTALIGKWYAVYYKDLSSSSVKISGAYKSGGKSACDTIEEAVREFTVDNGYFSSNSECSKVTVE